MTAELHHLAAAYALDALDALERRDFESHFADCDLCVVEVEQFRAVAAGLAETQATTPPPDLKRKVLAEIGQTRQMSPLTPAINQRRRPTRIVRLGIAAAAALFVVGGIAGIALLRSNGDRTSDVVNAPDRVVTTLDALVDEAVGNVQVVWSDERDQVLIIGSGLAVPGPDEAYALWTLQEDGVAPAGLFTSLDGNASALLSVEDEGAVGWGITIEPATGSPQPTTDVLFAGTV